MKGFPKAAGSNTSWILKVDVKQDFKEWQTLVCLRGFQSCGK
jgi:hypothetical protein